MCYLFMKPYIKILLIFVFSINSIFLFCQNNYFTLGFSESISSFRFFEESSNKKDNEMKWTTPRLSTAVGYRLHLGDRDNVGYLKIEAGNKQSGAQYYIYNQHVSWHLQYLFFSIGGGFALKIGNDLYLCSGASYYGSYLLNGNQISGIQYYNKTMKNRFKKFDHGFIISMGLYGIFGLKGQKDWGKGTNLFAEMNYHRGLAQIERDMGQRTFNHSIGLTIGFMFEITSR